MNAPIMLFIPSIINPVALSVIIALWAPSPLSVGDAEHDGRPGSLKRRPRKALPHNPQSAGLNASQHGNRGQRKPLGSSLSGGN